MRVPKFKQQRKLSCGPAALRMVFEYYGEKLKEKEVIDYVGGLKNYGTLAIDLAEFALNSGFRVEALTYCPEKSRGIAKVKPPSLKDVNRLLKRDIPVILCVRSCILYDKKLSDMGHFIVLTGSTKNGYRYNDPKDGRSHTISEEKLLFAWHNDAIDSSAYLIALY